MYKSSDFLLFPWQQPFLPALKDYIGSHSDPGRTLVIVPNQRPWRYFSELYAQEKKAAALPKMLSFPEIATIWSAASASAAYCQANLLDQVNLLRECVRELGKSDPALSERFATMSMPEFMPWGMRLAGLIEEIFSHGIQPVDLGNLEGEVEPLAAALLQALGRIAALYRSKLESAQPAMMTPGLESLLASLNSSNIPQYLLPQPDRPVFIAGFSTLNGTEDRLFHALWQAGAQICLHGDPALAGGGKLHPAAAAQAQWLERWRTKTELVCTPLPNEPHYSFFSAYDNHSQLERMAADFAACDQIDPNASTAIILPDAGLLMPTLHHLPQRDINISMGYPLKRTQLQSFLDDIFQLQMQRSPDGRYYWRNLLRLIHQPYLGMLAAGPNREINLRRALRKLDQAIRSGAAKYVDISKLKAQIAPELSSKETELLKETLSHMIEQPAIIQTTRGLADKLEKLCNFMVECGGKGWKRFPLDAEALSRLQNHVLPVLRDNLLNSEHFSLIALYGLMNMLLDQERIPFEADPLVGAQILGLLETRLLHFDQVFILNASDDILPGDASQDPLLPDSLRKLAGLPDNRSRQKIVEYNLYRLLANAKKVFFYWAEGVAHSGLAAGKQYRSRYIEQLIWEHERKQGKLLAPGEAPLATARTSARLNRKRPGAIGRTDRINVKMSELLKGEISASMLNRYMRCPVQFAMRSLLNLRSPEEVNEGDDLPLAGQCIHQTLAKLLDPYKGQLVRLADVPEDSLRKVFNEKLKDLDMAERLPVDSYLMLERAGHIYLKKYLENQKELTRIKDIEKDLQTTQRLLGRDYVFRGRMDRIDERAGQEVILDYKTGKIPKTEATLWQDGEFFDSLRQYCEKHANFDERGDELLHKLAERVKDIQMPVYMLMLAKSSGRIPANAIYVDLLDKSGEIPLFAEMGEAESRQLLDRCETAVGFILRHMENSLSFKNSESACEYCEFKTACRV